MTETMPLTRMLSVRAICDRYGICSRTVYRWVETGALPQPLVLNKRLYFDLRAVEQREREGMNARPRAKAEPVEPTKPAA